MCTKKDFSLVPTEIIVIIISVGMTSILMCLCLLSEVFGESRMAMDEKNFLEEIQGSTIVNCGMYEGIFKDFYHALHSQTDEFDLAFYSMECVPAKGNILELACGDGRISIPLIRKGCSFIGVDNSEEQLDELRSHLTEEENERVQLLNQDVLKLDIAEEIAVVIMPATSISLIGENIEKLEGMFRKIYRRYIV